MAARLLGVSHTTLNRWAQSGDLPLVFDVRGNHTVPVAALLALHERVERERDNGRRLHVLEPAMVEDRQRAEALDVQAPLADLDEQEGGHDRATRRSLAYHRALASRLDEDMVARAREVLQTWRDLDRIHPTWAARWEELLDRSAAEIAPRISANTPDAADLRQSSPLARVDGLPLPAAQREHVAAQLLGIG